MKSFLLIILAALSVPFFSYAQGNIKSGIGTANPQQALHIAGPTSAPVAVGNTGVLLVKPTVRIDGLNSTNNTAHNASDGANSLKRVYASQNGDLVLVNAAQESLSNQQFGDGTISNSSITSLLGAGIESPALKTQSFTLTEPSVVNITASLNVQLSAILTDGTAKLYGAYFRFSAVPAASGISTTANFGRNEKSYTNTQATGTTGDFMITPRADLVLPAGTYTVNLYGYMQGGALTFTVNFANSTNGGENLIITAAPQQFQ